MHEGGRSREILRYMQKFLPISSPALIGKKYITLICCPVLKIA